MWSVWIIGLGSVCWDAKEGLASSVQIALEDAILKDFQERHDAELKYWGGRLGRKVKSVTIVTENGEEDIEFKDSVISKQKNRNYEEKHHVRNGDNNSRNFFSNEGKQRRKYK